MNGIQWYNVTTIYGNRKGYIVVSIPTYNRVSKGDIYGKWLVIGDAFPQTHPKTHSIQWFAPCRCECGTFRAVRTAMLLNGHSPSCGVCNRPRRGMKHGAHVNGHRDRLYVIWSAMKQRCYNAKNMSYSSYGGRGISVCDEWRTDFVPFRDWALANGYRDGLSLDRIDNDGHYVPGNCRWATEAEQKRNMRQTVMLVAYGETKCLTDWAHDDRCVVGLETFRARIRLGWDVASAMQTPSRRGNNRYMKRAT